MEKYMNDIDTSFNDLIECIKNNEKYKEYLKIKEILLKDEEINSLIKDIKKLQKKITKDEFYKRDCTLDKKKLNQKLEQLNNYPIYIDFCNIQSDLNNMFQIIKNTIEKCLYDITN